MGSSRGRSDSPPSRKGEGRRSRSRSRDRDRRADHRREVSGSRHRDDRPRSDRGEHRHRDHRDHREPREHLDDGRSRDDRRHKDHRETDRQGRAGGEGGRGREKDERERGGGGGHREERRSEPREDDDDELRGGRGGRAEERGGRGRGGRDGGGPPRSPPTRMPPPPPPPRHQDGSQSPRSEPGEDEWAGGGEGGEDEGAGGAAGLSGALAGDGPPPEEDPTNFGLSGKLAEETNKVGGIAIKFVEPPEAAKPTTRWRLYGFKNDKPLEEPLFVHRQSCYLFGRERKICDVPTDHPSCSKQQAVLQYRQVEVEGKDGMLKRVVKPYIMDLGSTNGTHLNKERLEANRYYELLEGDMIKFGNSSRDYVLLHDNSKM